MKDRVPKYPGRMKLTHSDGTVEYVTIERADEPVEEGTPLNKASLLSDDTAVMLGFQTDDDPTVDEALAKVFASKQSFQENDLYMYIMQTHPILAASPYKNIFKFAQVADHEHSARTVSLSGDAETISVYDNKVLTERM